MCARSRPLVLLLALVLALLAPTACKKKNGAEPAAPAPTPSVRLFVTSTVAGALEPCGCVKDMLGGVDHAAALIESQSRDASASLVVGAGPMWFLDPTLRSEGKTQDTWKAETLARAFGTMGLVAWAPGANDWAAGEAKLAELAKAAGARILAANLKGAVAGADAVHVVESGGYKVGFAGVSVPKAFGAAPDGVTVADAEAALQTAKKTLDERGAQVRIALVAMDRGAALRLAERVAGFQVMVVGKPFDRGEGNDAPTPPVLLGETLVVQPPNHLQAVAIVDLFVRDGSFRFDDGAGLEHAERRATLKRQIDELERRIAGWEKSGAAKTDIEARRKDLGRLRGELAKISDSKPPEKGSFFHYALEEVREGAGSSPKVAGALSAYYKRVNEANRVAFADKKPEPAAEGKPSYVGGAACAACHAEEHVFWKKTGHAGAYATLTRQHKQFNLDCVGCHVTGYDKPGGSTVTHVEKLTDVQCEVCHGPGSQHPDDPKDPKLLVFKPEKTLCAPACHHPPHVKPDWSVDQAWKHIIGPGHGG